MWNFLNRWAVLEMIQRVKNWIGTILSWVWFYQMFYNFFSFDFLFWGNHSTFNSFASIIKKKIFFFFLSCYRCVNMQVFQTWPFALICAIRNKEEKSGIIVGLIFFILSDSMFTDIFKQWFLWNQLGLSP